MRVTVTTIDKTDHVNYPTEIVLELGAKRVLGPALEGGGGEDRGGVPNLMYHRASRMVLSLSLIHI